MKIRNPLEYEETNYTHPRATLSKDSKGRRDKIEPDDSPFRSDFQRDIHRIIYSQPFRRLRHKTQVFFLVNNDHVCTRLEHSLNVAAAARTVARSLGLNEDLAEAIGLGHDLGHAPFGHHGEEVLSELAEENQLPNKPFQHEVHGLRIVDRLGALDSVSNAGLNLSFEVRDGIISHNGEKLEDERILIPYNGEKVLEEIKTRGGAKNPVTLEGCIVRIVDKIAYAARDLHDGIKAGLIRKEEIPQDITKYLGCDTGEIVGRLINDLIRESGKYYDRICLSDETYQYLVQLIKYNYENIYRTPKVDRYKIHATQAIKALFYQLCKNMKESERLAKIDKLPESSVYKTLAEFIETIHYSDKDSNEFIVFEFISGMTDNYVIRCLDEIFMPKAIV